jgi:hypothetical protein
MKFSISLMGKSNVGDVNYFPTVLKMNFDTGIARSLGHRAKPLRFFYSALLPTSLLLLAFLLLFVSIVASFAGFPADPPGIL